VSEKAIIPFMVNGFDYVTFNLIIWAQVKGFVAKNNTTFRLKDVKELVYGGRGGTPVV
jgi:hypothetical protein